uniref:Uncharacterized protein n=1 Tax=Macrostomum lignano TaxID=282301 RepID=A0A1I8H3K8_9PLAT
MRRAPRLGAAAPPAPPGPALHRGVQGQRARLPGPGILRQVVLPGAVRP